MPDMWMMDNVNEAADQTNPQIRSPPQHKIGLPVPPPVPRSGMIISAKKSKSCAMADKDLRSPLRPTGAHSSISRNTETRCALSTPPNITSSLNQATLEQLLTIMAEMQQEQKKQGEILRRLEQRQLCEPGEPAEDIEEPIFVLPCNTIDDLQHLDAN
ncbi:PREDICTED: uncharacterized protein LOC106810477 [Priapulus caudatus]|uniref:Uncharacterized protein LOC106810477 n=1 Tax=Priapulus caudatus TaxID=37621 RepID=A0ABM1EAX0_PRICU|nr:PREDICTED: uncharacterized protein LOC106810477 [Priapulus caudatus]XP_014669342.1 PREDICTED: uncharacterized protein LOC106810477 [Priapulus caudatus]XP_014669343.1 PREDICTED: uncharacterized protein LOC106810477 [Priapulus caudatus]